MIERKQKTKIGILLTGIGTLIAIIVIVTLVALPRMREKYSDFNPQMTVFAKFISFTQHYVVVGSCLSLTCLVLAMLTFRWKKGNSSP